MVMSGQMDEGLGHHVYYGSVHQFIVMRYNLIAGKGKGAKEVKLADDAQHLSVFHHWKSIEVVFLK